MNKYYLPQILKKKRVELGDGWINAYIIFEWKPLFSIIIYNWKTIKQNRYHSHAFPAIAFTLSGSYAEEYFDKGKPKKRKVRKLFRPRYLKKNYTHRILKAEKNTWTLVLVGPWQKYWYEYFQDTDTWIQYTWGRKVISKTKKIPKELL